MEPDLVPQQPPARDAPPAPHRTELVTLVFTDIVGSTAFKQTSGVGWW